MVHLPFLHHLSGCPPDLEGRGNIVATTCQKGRPMGFNPETSTNQRPNSASANRSTNFLINAQLPKKLYKKGLRQSSGETQRTREDSEHAHMDLYDLVWILAYFLRFLIIYCRSSGTQTESRVSLGPESV
jgi:hypothetical protein